MESLVDDPSSLSTSHKAMTSVGHSTSFPLGASYPPHPVSLKQYKYEVALAESYRNIMDHQMREVITPVCSMIDSTCSCKGGAFDSSEQHLKLINREFKLGGMDNDLVQMAKDSSQKQDLILEPKTCFNNRADDSEDCDSGKLLESDDFIAEGGADVLNSQLSSQLMIDTCPSPQNSVNSSTQYMEAKQSFTYTEVSERASSMKKSVESGEVSNTYDFVESRKTNIYRGSTGSDASDESSSSSLTHTIYKPHKANDSRWEAIKVIKSRDGMLGFNNFRLLRRLGCGDIGTVHLSELIGTRSYFAIKVMDKAVLASRNKLLRVQTEREILQLLDHPFLPTLYTHFETEKFSCLVMEYCPGGDLHSLRQKQTGKYFPENAARFYVAEVLLALEYLHMLGIIYRDLKPENVLVREDGHIMLSDFDLSLRCAVSPTLVKSSNSCLQATNSVYCAQPPCIQPSCVIQSACIQPSCFAPRFLSKHKKEKKAKPKAEVYNQVNLLPELLAEPTNARSMSFVGTHE